MRSSVPMLRGCVISLGSERPFTAVELLTMLSCRIAESMEKGSGAELRNLCQAYVWLHALSPGRHEPLTVVFDGCEELAE